MYVPAAVEEGVHIQVHEDGEDLLIWEAVKAELVTALQATEVVSLQPFFPFLASR